LVRKKNKQWHADTLSNRGKEKMTPELAVDICRKAIQTILMCSAPMLIIALVVGLFVSVFQAATQINEQTLTFVPKIVAVFITLLIFGSWIIKIVSVFTVGLFDIIATL
jgi:flagellar biosynthesis protein FliQ